MISINSISVIGAGAIGGFYGAKLQQAGFFVEFYSHFLKNTKKLKIKSIWGDFQIPIRVFDHTSYMTPSDLIIISLKSLPSIPLIEIVSPLCKKNSIILFLQNGINQEEKFYQKIQKNKKLREKNLILLGGLAFSCIHRISQNEIHHIDYGNIKIGSFHHNHKKYAKAVVNLFQNAGIQTELVSNLRKSRWEKLLWNIAFNTLSVIAHKADTTQLISSNHTIFLSKELMKEIIQIAQYEKQSPGLKKISEMIQKTKTMKPYKTSMLIDYENKRPMEIEAIIGEPLQLAKKYNIHTPYLNFCYRILKFLDEQNQKK